MSEAKALSNDCLKGIMTDALVDRGACTDIDADMPVGIYRTYPSTQGTFPPHRGNFFRYGILIVLPKRGNNIYQMLIGEEGEFATRIRYGGSWMPWKQPVPQTSRPRKKPLTSRPAAPLNY